jgi:carbonic anhydrase/acetyltransferase-like protein (isoleucine patch superfamily)
MPLYSLGDEHPQVDESAWVAPSAQVMGRVWLGAQASVWFGAVLRGDTEALRIGAGSNIQDQAMLHADIGFALTVGERVTVGHQAVLHGCTVGEESLIGIQAVVLNGAVIGRHCLVGACSLVTEGKTFPDGSLIMGSPAKVVRPLTEAEVARLRLSAEHYALNAQRFAQGLRQSRP